MDESFDGQCFCGRVHYRMHGRPMFIHCCHCRDCQQQAGSAFVINGLIEAARIETVDGAPKAVTMRTDSGHPHDIYRCEACQSALWSDYGRRGVMVFVRVATLDQAHDIAPDAHIFTRSKMPWVVLPPGAHSFDVYYDMQKEWSKESLARRAAILGNG